jgi:hypothetical protein
MARWGGSRLEATEIPDQPNPRLGLEAMVLNAEPDPDRPATTIDIAIHGLECHVLLDAGGAIARMGPAPLANATLAGDARAVLNVALGAIDLDSATEGGALEVSGDADAVRRLLVDIGLPQPHSMRHQLATSLKAPPETVGDPPP